MNTNEQLDKIIQENQQKMDNIYAEFVQNIPDSTRSQILDKAIEGITRKDLFILSMMFELNRLTKENKEIKRDISNLQYSASFNAKDRW